jgi:hypothetical protein
MAPYLRLALMIKPGRIATVLLTVASVTAACSGSASSSGIPSGARRVAGSCGSTPLYKGASWSWTRSASVPSELSQATSNGHLVSAFLFGYPLRSGHPTNPGAKILWVMRRPRNGSDLTVAGRPLGKWAPQVTVTEPPGSAPGEVYPTIVDVPSPGCWQFTLSWNGNHDTIDLHYD